MAQYRVWKTMRGFTDVEADSIEEAHDKGQDVSLNQYDWEEEDTDIDLLDEQLPESISDDGFIAVS